MTSPDLELDISSALADTSVLNGIDEDGSDFGDDSITFSGPRVVKKQKLEELNPEDIFASDSEGEEEFIAARQAAQNRKAGVARGRSGKQGGGFQAMGEFLLPHTSYPMILRCEKLKHWKAPALRKC